MKMKAIFLLLLLNLSPSLCDPKEKINISLELIDIILTGTSNEMYALKDAKEAILKTAPVFEKKVVLSATDMRVMWDILKANRSVYNLTLKDLQDSAFLLAQAPDSDLSQFNVGDINIIKFLGSMKIFDKITASLIINSIRDKWKPSTLIEAKYINGLNGLICGLTTKELKDILPSEFREIKPHVFNNLNACSPDQIQILYDHAKLTTGYGPPQSWTQESVARLGMIMTAVGKKEIRQVRPKAMKGISDEAIIKMDVSVLKTIRRAQARELSVTAKKLFMDKVGWIITAAGTFSAQFVFLLIIISQLTQFIVT